MFFAKRMPFRWCLHICSFFLVFYSAFSGSMLMGTTYYVSKTGNDRHAGTTPATAWASIARVNAAILKAGDEVLFEGSTIFAGNLNFDGVECGTASEPIKIGSFGTGKAIIHAGSASHGMCFYDCAGFEISNLKIMGSGRISNDYHGIIFYTEVAGPALSRLNYIRIDHVEVSGFNKGGITIEADGDFTDKGYEDVEITHSTVHDCGDHGIEVVAKFMSEGKVYPCADIYIANCKVYDNPGEIGKKNKHTGSGIVVGNTEDVLIENCVAYNNGAENISSKGGPVGIWLWDCKDGIIQHCESYKNHTGDSSRKDGGGFDLDGGCVNCTIQYCYSHDNDGAGFLLAQFDDARDMLNNQIRYCISENDGRKNDYASVQIWRSSSPSAGKMEGIYIFNNTFFIDANTKTTPAVFKSMSGGLTRVRVSNNVFIAAGGVRLVDKSHAEGADIVFAGNMYFSVNKVYAYREGDETYKGLADWREDTGQEMLWGRATGFESDPRLQNPGNGGTVGDPHVLVNLSAYKALYSSPVKDAGLDLSTLYGVDIGERDFWGTPVPVNLRYDIGACEAFEIPRSADSLPVRH